MPRRSPRFKAIVALATLKKTPRACVKKHQKQNGATKALKALKSSKAHASRALSTLRKSPRLAERNAVKAAADEALSERNAVKAAADEALAERNAVKAAADEALAERNAVKAATDDALAKRNAVKAAAEARLAIDKINEEQMRKKFQEYEDMNRPCKVAAEAIEESDLEAIEDEVNHGLRYVQISGSGSEVEELEPIFEQSRPPARQRPVAVVMPFLRDQLIYDPDVIDEEYDPTGAGPYPVPDVERGSLIAVTVNDFISPDQNFLLTYVACGNGKMAPVCLNSLLLDSAVRAMDETELLADVLILPPAFSYNGHARMIT